MGRDIPHFWHRSLKGSSPNEVRKWPKIGEYKENGLTVSVFAPAYLSGYTESESAPEDEI